MGENASTRPGFSPDLVEAVLSHLVDSVSPGEQPALIGLSALQGSGKSTLARQLVKAAGERGIAALGLSLDDFYLGRRQRLELSHRVHALLAVRGVPGTHEIGLLERSLDAIASADPRSPAWLPSFDKGSDTRRPPSRWTKLACRPQWIILEGWCVGVPAEPARALHLPINRLEREEDSEGVWRRYVNAQLSTDYARLWTRLQELLLLQAPGWRVVDRWRDEQERALRRRGAPRAMSRPALRRFLEHTERISQHALRSLPERADLIVELGENREVKELSVPRRRAASRDPAVRY
jgi:D-glycerate 3-kinase